MRSSVQFLASPHRVLPSETKFFDALAHTTMAPISPEQVNKLLAVFRRFSQFEGQPRLGKPSPYEDVVASRITESSEAREPLPLLLPAFPWKNPNPEKTLSPASPDFGEELGLARLNDLCQELAEIYPHGAVLTLVADGPVYNGEQSLKLFCCPRLCVLFLRTSPRFPAHTPMGYLRPTQGSLVNHIIMW